jgi:hypothetical protein
VTLRPRVFAHEFLPMSFFRMRRRRAAHQKSFGQKVKKY